MNDLPIELIDLDVVNLDMAEKQEFSKEKKKILFDNMRRLGITALRVNFQGSGDSGQIEEIVYNGLHQSTIELEKMSTEGTKFETPNGQRMVDGKWVPHMEEKTPMNMYELVEDLSYEILSNVNYDWCNNDGGQGDVYIFTDPEGGEHITVDMNTNYTTSDNHPIVVV